MSTQRNPADLATRPIKAKDLEISMWLQGPLSTIEKESFIAWRKLAKLEASSCYKPPCCQKIADLPIERFTLAPPFTYVGWESSDRGKLQL